MDRTKEKDLYEAHMADGKSAMDEQQYGWAAAKFKIALEQRHLITEEDNDPIIWDVYFNFGHALLRKYQAANHGRSKDIREAHRLLDLAKQLMKRPVSDCSQQSRMQVYLTLAEAEFQMRSFELSLSSYKKSLALWTELDGHPQYSFQEADINFKIGSCLLCLGQNSNAMHLFLRVSALCDLGLKESGDITIKEDFDSLKKKAAQKARDILDMLVPTPGEQVKDVLQDILPPPVRERVVRGRSNRDI